jgi:spoIIIJ-associated protein
MISEIPMRRGEQWLKTLLQLTAINTEVRGDIESRVIGYSDSPQGEAYWLKVDESNLTPEQIRTLIGPNGSVLDAIQYLANSILNLNQIEEQQASYTIELNGYRIRRQAEIREIAESAASEVRSTGREVEIRSLSSAERRQVHRFLKDFTDLETFSRGKEPHRHLVVRPAY